MASVYRTVEDVDFDLSDCPALPRPDRVMLTTPTHYDIQYVINPHMSDHVGSVDTGVAAQQWKALRATYTALGIEPHIVDGQPGLPDMVFCANQTLPFLDPDARRKGVVLSQMRAEQRRDEVTYFADAFGDLGYSVESLPESVDTSFEGMGDGIWHPGRLLLWGGYGFRSDLEIYEVLSGMLGTRVVALELTDADFYHLDTCFSPLDEHSVLIYPGAFTAEGLDLINHFFTTVVEAPEEEARHQFACNAHCPNGHHVLIQEGCTTTEDRLRRAGFKPIELDTSEFMKSGGSVFCMKQMIW
jgi:N-dimethylarginine dimethylaminohydrolase